MARCNHDFDDDGMGPATPVPPMIEPSSVEMPSVRMCLMLTVRQLHFVRKVSRRRPHTIESTPTWKEREVTQSTLA